MFEGLEQGRDKQLKKMNTALQKMFDHGSDPNQTIDNKALDLYFADFPYITRNDTEKGELQALISAYKAADTTKDREEQIKKLNEMVLTQKYHSATVFRYSLARRVDYFTGLQAAIDSTTIQEKIQKCKETWKLVRDTSQLEKLIKENEDFLRREKRNYARLAALSGLMVGGAGAGLLCQFQVIKLAAGVCLYSNPYFWGVLAIGAILGPIIGLCAGSSILDNHITQPNPKQLAVGT